MASTDSDLELQRLEQLMRQEFLGQKVEDEQARSTVEMTVLDNLQTVSSSLSDHTSRDATGNDIITEEWAQRLRKDPKMAFEFTRLETMLAESSVDNTASSKNLNKQANCARCVKDLSFKQKLAGSDIRQCSGCGKVWYCSSKCQKKDWVAHRLTCGNRKAGYVSTVPLVYTRLDSRLATTRLLKLLPGHRGTALHGELFIANIDTKPTISYEALSYTWGSAEDKMPMIVNKTSTMITLNLYTALQALRHPSLERILWIDALCINQCDLLEKSAHLRQMPQIYGTAQRVLVWLGEDKDNSRLALQSLKRMAAPRYENTWLNRELTEEFQRLFLDDIAIHRALSTFAVKRPYWERAWIVQEVVSAQRADIICGTDTIPWEELKRATKAVRRCLNGSATKAFSFSAAWASVTSLVFATQTVDSKVSILYLLWHLRNRQCADPKDKLYSMLGLPSKEDTSTFAINYALSADEIFTQFAIWHIKYTGTLNVMRYACPQNHATSLPSWVPDWRYLPNLTPLGVLSDLTFPFPLYCAGTKLDLPADFFDGLVDIQPSQPVSFGGVRVDRIKTLGPRFIIGFDNVCPGSKEVQKCIEMVRCIPANDNPYSSKPIVTSDFTYVPHEGYAGAMRGRPNRARAKTFQFPRESTVAELTLIEALWRTLTGDYVKVHKLPIDPKTSTSQERIIEDVSGSLRPNRNFWPIWQYWYDQHQGKRAKSSEPPIFSEMVEGVLGNRTFFITERGYMGYAGPDAAPGDLVVILFGAHVPHVLRPVHDMAAVRSDDTDTRARVVYQHRGDCFLQGVMHGEAMRNLPTVSDDNIFLLV